MITGEWKTLTILATAKKSAEVDLGRDYEYLNVVIPALVSGTLNLEVAQKTGGTFQDLGVTATTGETTGGYSDTWVLGGWQYIKIESSATQTATDRVFYVRGYRE